MRVLLPFWDMRIMPRYVAQFQALAKAVGDLHVLYVYGEPRPEWEAWGQFHRLKLRPGYKYLSWLQSRPKALDPLPEGIDAVYSLSGLWMGYYGDYIARALGVPHVIRLRGDIRECRANQRAGALKQMAFGWMDNRIIRRADLVIPISLRLRDLALVSYPVYNAYEPQEDPPVAWRATVGYIGRIAKEKGSQLLRRLLEAPDLDWWIAGPIQDLGFTLPEGSRVAYTPWVPYEALPAFYKGVSVIVAPSRSEGFPNTLLEAYYHGVPVVGSPTFFPREAPIYGREVRSSNPKDWIEAIKESVNRPLSPAPAKEYARWFTWKKHGREIKALLEKAIREHK